MTDKWKKLTLREAGVSLIDCDHRTPPPSESGYPYIAIPQLKQGRIDLKDVRRISPENFIDWTRKAKPQHHDVILSRRCNPGETAYVPEGLECALGQNLVLLRANGKQIFPPFLRWLTQGPEWWEQVGKFINVGAVFDSLKCADIPNFPFTIPSIQDQKKIAWILGTIDEKIELNRRINATLEAMARALFQSWFVDFDPVRAKLDGRKPAGMDDETAALFPSEFRESEMGPIPKGWYIEKIEKIALISSGKRPFSRSEVSTPDCGVPLFGGGGKMGYVPLPLFDYPILFTGRVGTLGLIFRADPPSWPSDNTLVIEPKSNFFEFTYFSLKELDLLSLNRGSTQPLLTQSDVKRQIIVLPPEKLVKVFEKLSRGFFKGISSNLLQNNTLKNLRDTLLPKLLNGEISISSEEVKRAVNA